MQKRCLSIPELSCKLDFLTTDSEARRKSGCSGLNTLADIAGIKRSTLKSDKAKGSMSEEREKALGRVCGFDPSWPEWSTDSCEKFKARWRQEAPQQKPSSGVAPDKTRLKCVEHKEPGCFNRRLAVLEMFVQQGNDDSPWPVSFHLMCRAAPIDGVCVAIKRAHIDLDCGGATTKKSEWLGIKNGGYVLPDAKVSIGVGAGEDRKPSWVIEAKEGCLGNVLPEAAYCVVRDASAGQVMSATLSVYVKNIKGMDESFCQPDGQSLGRTKKAFLDRIAAKGVRPDLDGWGALCWHEFLFVADGDQAELLKKAGE